MLCMAVPEMSLCCTKAPNPLVGPADAGRAHQAGRLFGRRRLRRLRVLDWSSADRNEIPVSVEVVRHPLAGATAVEVRVTPAAGDTGLARALAEAVVAELRHAVDG